MMFAFTRQDGILWLPDSRTQARVALTNTGSATFAVTVSVGQKQNSIKLGSRETKVINLKEFMGELGNGPITTLLSLTHTYTLAAFRQTHCRTLSSSGRKSGML